MRSFLPGKEGPTHICPQNQLSLPSLLCCGHPALGQILLQSLPQCMTWANDVHCLVLSLSSSDLDRKMLAGPILGSSRTTGLAGGPIQKMPPVAFLKGMKRTGLPGTPGPRTLGRGVSHIWPFVSKSSPLPGCVALGG